MNDDLVRALKGRGESINALGVALGVPRSAVLAVLAGGARAGTVALVAERARALGWLQETDPAPAA